MTGLVRIGVDVGSANTDAALLRGTDVLATVKTATTADVTGGVEAAIRAVLTAGGLAGSEVSGVMIGTTHFLTALVEGRHLQRVGILRLCGRATRSLWPMVDRPDALRTLVDGGPALVGGWVNFHGLPIAALDHAAIRQACNG